MSIFEYDRWSGCFVDSDGEPLHDKDLADIFHLAHSELFDRGILGGMHTANGIITIEVLKTGGLDF